MEGISPKKNKAVNISSALYDIKPVTAAGDLDIEKINRISAVLDLKDSGENLIQVKEIKIQDSRFRSPRRSFGEAGGNNSRSLQGQPLKPKGCPCKGQREAGMTERSGNDDKNVFLPRKNKHREQILAKDFLGKKPIDFILTNTNDLDILPSREDLLAELDKIENFEEFLKKVEVSKGFINSSAEPALSDSEAPQNDIEKTLRKCQTLKPKSAIYKKSRYSKGLALKNTRERRKKLEQAFNIEEFYFPEVARETVLDGENMAKSGVSKWRRGTAGWDWSGRSKPLINFLISGIVIALIVPLAAWIGYGFKVKQDVLSSGLSAYQNLLSAKQALEQTDWQNAEYDFGLARADFFEAHQEINKLGQLTLGIIEQLPGGSLVASGSHLVKVGENLAQAGQGLAAAANLFSFNNLFNSVESLDSPQKNILALKNNKPLTESIVLSKSDLSAALENIRVANQELEQIKISSLPDDIQENIVFLKAKLPLVEEAFFQALDYSEALLSILGHDNSRKYLLIFQNNGEVRATGGFIGTYGLLTLDQGRITDLFIDGVYNADGQLHEKIIPPRPLQKISTAWSMHDANWFADFPSSAEKIAWFYEKTGGPTVDGVISLTPAVIERFLKLTGPISMPEYGVVLDSSNFVELIQYKVEIDYDKELNRPKKILADFTPKFIEAISGLSSQKRKKALEIIFDCFEEKHILTYFSNPSLEKLAKKEGWSGEVASTEKDYLSVVSSNINGYKTDKMIKETIQHQAEIQEDGSIVDTLTITRQHQGGRSEYDWWNKVNSNYLRVYLPLGSQLISANGQSLEIYQPPIDYQKHNFKKDALVDSIESKMIIDKKTGTRIFEESGKTVFANWAYVSPGETVVLSYKYKLPFKIDLTKPADSYSLLAQKQLGSLGSSFNHQIKFPNSWRVSWKYPENLNSDSGFLKFDGDLKTDKFLGASFKF